MLYKGGLYIFENPTHDTVHDACRAAGVDVGDCYAVVAVQNIEGWGVELFRADSTGGKLIGLSGFSFETQRDAVDWVEPQVPQVRVAK
jgi:hypothetical protein